MIPLLSIFRYSFFTPRCLNWCSFQFTGDCCSKLIHVQEPIESFLPETATNSGRSSSDQIQQTSEAWNYRIEEIDPTVIDELPLQIQDEIRAWLQPHKRRNIVKRGSSIADYFLPSKNREKNPK